MAAAQHQENASGRDQTAKEDQESDGISASYTMGGITVAGAMNSTDNIAGSTATTADKDAYEMSVSFAF